MVDKAALEQFGVGRRYHMGEIMINPSHPELRINAADGNPDRAKLLGRYGATVDFPACSFWRELADLYPRRQGRSSMTACHELCGYRSVVCGEIRMAALIADADGRCDFFGSRSACVDPCSRSVDQIGL